jgi:DNA recombination-dependent growth factor C
LFEIIDQEFSIEENKRKVIAHCLSLVINIGINKFEENSKIKNKLNENNEIIDFITSSLLARGNINNIEIRIAIVYYLSRIDNNSKINLQKILSRFGQSLLEHVFTKYFSENETSKTAFLFLADHLKDFLSGSAHLAEMGNAVLQNQMLKNPVEFINFSDKYSDLIYEKLDELKSLNIHLSFLLKKSCEINKIELINGLQKIIINYF